MKKKIAVIACALGLPGEKGYSRFPYLADMLSKRGYEVDLYTSTFNHWEKAQRSEDRIREIEKNLSYNVILCYEPGYKKNVDVRRVYSHLILSNTMVERLKVESQKRKYDLVYVVIPDNALSAKVCLFCKKQGIPVVVDVEDLWPEGMYQDFSIPIISNIIYAPFTYYAKKTYENADACVGTSDEYRDEPLKYNCLKKGNRITVYVGCDLDVFDGGVKKNIKSISKKENEFWIIYTGTFGTSYDIGTLIRAMQVIKAQGEENIKLKLLGGGPLEDDYRRIMAEKPCNVDILGYQPYEKMSAYLVASDVTVNSFVKKAAQSIVNKVGDYLAAGKPMINTCSSPEFSNKVDNDGFGINVEAENVNAMVEGIMKLYNNKSLCTQMGKKARSIAEEQFDRKVGYQKITELIEGLV